VLSGFDGLVVASLKNELMLDVAGHLVKVRRQVVERAGAAAFM
jgi:hypothetical protein